MKTIVFIAIFASFVLFLRLNLPPSDVNDYIEMKSKINFFQEISAKLLYSQTFADWSYTDYIIVKVACSERLKVRFIAIPFYRWQLLEKNINGCI